jgi:prepilin-type N-terminal cleavage/methylation domain-containing protein
MKMKENGFTLLEIIIVLSLVTLVLGLSTVFFAGYLPSARLDAAGREISGMIRHARSLARMNMARQTVMIDLDGRTYGIEGRAIRALPPDVVIRVIDPLSGEIQQGKYALVFNQTGGMAGGTILLSRGKKTVMLRMDPITGAATLRGGPDDFP